MATDTGDGQTSTPGRQSAPSISDADRRDRYDIKDSNPNGETKNAEEGEEEGSDEDDDDSESSWSEEPAFPYTRDELIVIIADFYTFLARLHLPNDAVKFPPPGGWPNITLESTSPLKKTPFVIDLLRHLPYIAEDDRANYNRVHYKCNVVDYSACSPASFERHASEFTWLATDCFELDPEAIEHSFILADGYESYGRSMLLNTATGELHVEVIRAYNEDPEDVAEYLGRLKQMYEILDIVPIPGEEDLAERLEQEEDGYEIELEREVLAQEREEFWSPSKLDHRWVRHLYRSFGWPGPEYRKDEALAAIQAFRASRNRIEDEE